MPAITDDANIDREWVAAIWTHVMGVDDRDKAREKAAEARHKELLAAVTKVSNALSDVAVMLGGRRAA